LTTFSGRLFRMGFPALPSATAELAIIDFVAQHDPEPEP
jgi:hypothetical protein